MSPLARSLLALAALFAAADAQANDNCKTQLLGTNTGTYITYVPVKTPAGGGRIEIQDACQEQQKGQLVGEVIAACNKNVQGEAPDIAEVNPGQLSRVDVICPDQCPQGADVQILGYCA